MRFRLDPLSPSGVGIIEDTKPVRIQQSTAYLGDVKITGLLTAGTNVTLGGTGTKQDPYIVNSSGSGGGGGTGDVVGPTSATDNAIARFDTTTGKLLQNSGAMIDDSGNLTATNLSGSNTGDQTTITGNAGTATKLLTPRTIGTTTGDATSTGSSFDGSANNTNALTLATVNSNVGSFGSATQVPGYTVNAKGLITAASNTSIQIAESQVTNLTTDLSAKAISFTITALKTANYTVAANEFVPVDTTSGSVVLTLPSAPADGTRIGTKMVIQGGTNIITITAGGTDVFNKVAGSTSVSVQLANQGIQYQYHSGIWYGTSGDIGVTALDARYQKALTLTTTGTSGAASLVGTTLNIPQYTGGGSSFTWTVVTGTSQTAAASNGYFANNAGLVTVTLPTTSAVGDTVSVAYMGAGGWKLAQPASNNIQFGNIATTTGTGGSLASVSAGDVVTVVCRVANTSWTVINSVGNLTVV